MSGFGDTHWHGPNVNPGLYVLGLFRSYIQIFNAWTKASGSDCLSRSPIKEIGDRILWIHCNFPCDLQRLCPHTRDIERGKATRYRQFLLCMGSVCLLGFFPYDFYDHYLLLFIPLYVFCHLTLDLWYCDLAKQLLFIFCPAGDYAVRATRNCT